MKFFSFKTKEKEQTENLEPQIQSTASSSGSKIRRVYLDYASTTPIDADVEKVMKRFESHFYNASSIYTEGVESKKAISDARKKIASILNVQSEEIIFTATGTEANNLALLGVFNAYKGKKAPHVITSAIEHSSILETCKEIERLGGEVTYIQPEKNGIIDPQKIKAALRDSTILVSIMYVNNEIGTIQSVGAIGRIVKEKRGDGKYPYFHTDASQGANYLPVHIGHLGANLVTLDSIKIYGPRGIGMLCVRKTVMISPIVFGGGQERGLRAGTENTSAIVGFAHALKLAEELREPEGERLFEFQEYLQTEIKKKFPNVIIHGEESPRLPNIVNICLPGLDSEFAVIKLDKEGIMASSASACQSNAKENYSQTVEALPEIGEQCKRSSLRFSMGRGTERHDVERLMVVLDKILDK